MLSALPGKLKPWDRSRCHGEKQRTEEYAHTHRSKHGADSQNAHPSAQGLPREDGTKGCHQEFCNRHRAMFTEASLPLGTRHGGRCHKLHHIHTVEYFVARKQIILRNPK